MGMQNMYEQSLKGNPLGKSSIWKHRSIVTFFIVFLRCQSDMITEHIVRLIIEVQVLFLNNMNGPREILHAEIRLDDTREPVAAFQTRFNKFSPRTNAILETASTSMPPSPLVSPGAK